MFDLFSNRPPPSWKTKPGTPLRSDPVYCFDRIPTINVAFQNNIFRPDKIRRYYNI